MKNWILIIAMLVLVCSGVIGVGITINVDSFQEARDRIVQWKDEVVIPLFERGVTVNKDI